jgi:hypothetical protein
LPGAIRYDHVTAFALSNCQVLCVLCRTCHDAKTTQRDIPTIVKAVRIADKIRGTANVYGRCREAGLAGA